MVVRYVMSKGGSGRIKVDGIFIDFVRIKGLSSKSKPNNGINVKECGCQYPAKEVKGITGAILKIQ